MLDTLTDVEIPGNLGAGVRQPGLLPYMNYLVDSVFLKFCTRTYKVNTDFNRAAETVLF